MAARNAVLGCLSPANCETPVRAVASATAAIAKPYRQATERSGPCVSTSKTNPPESAPAAAACVRPPRIGGARSCKPSLARHYSLGASAAGRRMGRRNGAGMHQAGERTQHMSRLRSLTVAAGVLAMAGCGQAISTDYNPSVRFTQYRTFALVSRPDSASHQLIDDRVRDAVAGELDAKGLTQTDREHADLFVGYGIVDRTHTEVYGGGWPWAGYGWRYYRYGVAWQIGRAHV